jgi:hypothetical protein
MRYTIPGKVRKIYGGRPPAMMFLRYGTGRSVMLSEYAEQLPADILTLHRTPFDTLDVSLLTTLETALEVIGSAHAGAGLEPPSLALCMQDKSWVLASIDLELR